MNTDAVRLAHDVVNGPDVMSNMAAMQENVKDLRLGLGSCYFHASAGTSPGSNSFSNAFTGLIIRSSKSLWSNALLIACSMELSAVHHPTQDHLAGNSHRSLEFDLFQMSAWFLSGAPFCTKEVHADHAIVIE
jgi:hypothetical protein